MLESEFQKHPQLLGPRRPHLQNPQATNLAPQIMVIDDMPEESWSISLICSTFFDCRLSFVMDSHYDAPQED